jgi:hypothetical protein
LENLDAGVDIKEAREMNREIQSKIAYVIMK